MRLVKFVISEAFKERLLNITSPISSELLNLKKVDFESNSYRNFISISNDDRTMISYVDRNKENKLNEILVRLIPEEINRNSLTSGMKITLFPQVFSHYKDENGKMARGASMIPFPYINQCRHRTIRRVLWSSVCINENYPEIDIPIEYIEQVEGLKNKVEMWNRDIWCPEKRIKTKAGKFVKTLFPNKFSDVEIEYFSNEYQKQAICECEDGSVIKELQGDSIKWAYLEDNYANLNGDLGSSCMRYSHCQEYFDIYIKNTNFVSLLVRIVNGKVTARSILWYPKGKNNPEKYHDRIYFNTNYDKQCMEVYMKANNYKDCFANRNWPYDLTILLDYGANDIKLFPYMDSFKYLKGNTLSTRDLGSYTLETQNGSYENSTCDRCECSSHDLRYITRGNSRGLNLCEECSVYLEDIDGYADYDDAVYSEYDDCYLYYDNAVYSKYMNDYIKENEAVVLANGEYIHKELEYIQTNENDYIIEGHSDFQNYIEINGEYYHKDSTIIYYNEEESEWDLVKNKKEKDELVQSEG